MQTKFYQKEGGKDMPDDTISASQITTWLFCPVSFRLNYELKERIKPSIYMVWGKALHEALEKNYKQKITSKKDLVLSEVYQTFVESFEQGVKKCIAPPNSSIESMLLTAENVLAKYLEEIAPKIQPKFVEYEFKLKLKKYPITIHGFIDLITENEIIKDYKTVGKTNKDWTQYKADDSIQLTLYSAAYRKMFLKREQGIEIDLIPRDNKPIFKTLCTSRTDEQVDYVLHLATVIQELKNKRLFYPYLQNCRQCPYAFVCPRK